MFRLDEYIEISKKNEKIIEERTKATMKRSKKQEAYMISASALFFMLLSLFFLIALEEQTISVMSFLVLTSLVSAAFLGYNLFKLYMNNITKRKFDNEKFLIEINSMKENVAMMDDQSIYNLLKEADKIDRINYKFFHNLYESVIAKKYEKVTELDYLREKVKNEINNKELLNE